MQYIQMLRRWWWLIVLAAALGGAAGYLVSQRTPPVYEASATLIVTVHGSVADPLQGLIPDQRDSLVKTFQELLLKRPVLDAVIADLGLSTDADALFKRLSITQVRDTQILKLTAQDASPDLAAAIANGTVAAFNRQAGALLANPIAANRAGLSVVEPAAPPSVPKNSPLRVLLIAVMAGALLGAGVALAAEYIDSTVRSRQDVSVLTDLTIVAEIPYLKGRLPLDKLVTLNAPASRTAETYRMIRLYLETGNDGNPIRTIVITSAGPQEGKSLTAANLAIALAQTGLRTVLIDTNLRRPTVHELFQKQNTHGVTTALRMGESSGAYSHTIESGVENLRLLLSGPLPEGGYASSARLLVPQRLTRLIDDCGAYADIQIFDSPAALDAIDTALLARSCDAALLVVQSQRTPAERLLRVRETIDKAHTAILGVVLNRVPHLANGSSLGVRSDQRSLPAPAQPALVALPLRNRNDTEPLPMLKNGTAKLVEVPDMDMLKREAKR